MNEKAVYSEISEPERKLIRSDGALYIILLLLVFAVIFAGNYLQNLLGIPRLFIQVGLYILLCIFAVVLYRKRLRFFRYTLTDRMLSTSRLVGKKERPEAQAHLSDITCICAYKELTEIPKHFSKCFHGKKEDSLAVLYKTSGGVQGMLLSPSAKMRDALLAAWKAARKRG